MPANNVCCPTDADESKRGHGIVVRLTGEEAADLDYIRSLVPPGNKPHSRSCYLRQSFRYRMNLVRAFRSSYRELRTLLPLEEAPSCSPSTVDRLQELRKVK